MQNYGRLSAVHASSIHIWCVCVYVCMLWLRQPMQNYGWLSPVHASCIHIWCVCVCMCVVVEATNAELWMAARPCM
jgi:hypothetical protein